MIGNFNDETNFPYNLLLTDTQVSRVRKAFANGSLANIKFSKTHLFKVIQSGGFLTSDAIDATTPLLLFPPFRMIN